MTGDPRHNVDRRLMTVDMLGLDLGSVGATTAGPEHNTGHTLHTLLHRSRSQISFQQRTGLTVSGGAEFCVRLDTL